MNTYLLQEDNTILLSPTTRTPIMEKSNCVDEIEFLSLKEYNDLDMETFDLVLEYKLPISKTHRIVTLPLTDNHYKDRYLKYTLPSTAATISGEPGKVELNLSFMKTEIDADGNLIRRVRNFAPAYIEVFPITTWFHVSDDGLTQLADLYLSNKAQIEALNEIAAILYKDKADDIRLDVETGEIYVISGDNKIGTGIKLSDLNNELVETGGATEGNLKIVRI